MPATNHREAFCRRKEARSRQLGDGLLAGIDEIGVLLALERKGSDSQHAVLTVEHDMQLGGNVVGHQCGHADAKVYIEAIAQLARRAGGHLFTCPGHQDAICRDRVVRCSMRR